MDEFVCQYKIKRWTTEDKTFAEVHFYDINPICIGTGDFESMAFDLLRSFSRVERATKIEEGELYIRRRNGQKEFVRKRKSITKHTEMCKCTHEHGFEERVPRRSSIAQREAELVARQQKLQAELAEYQARERRPYHYGGGSGRKLKFDFELEEREPAQYAPQPQKHRHEHVHHHRRASHHHHHHMHYERRPSYVRERPVPVRRPSYCDDALLYQRIVANRRRRSSGGYRVIARNYLYQQPEVVRYENRSPNDYCQ